MSEEKPIHDAETADALEMLGKGYDNQPAAIIESPRKVTALRDKGLIEYQVWGWVKMSAKFLAHLKYLKGAKLAIWQCIALSIDESGTCKMTIKDICKLTDYSHTEVIESLKELEDAGYLGINKDGKTNIYSPVFVARGEEKPKETLVKKVDSTTAYQYESSPLEENSVPSIIRVKRVNTTKTKIKSIEAAMMEERPVTEDDLPKYLEREKEACNAFESAFGITRPWDWYPAKTSEESVWREFRADILRLYEEDKDCFTKYVTWMREPFAKGAKTAIYIKSNPQDFPTIWAGFLASNAMYGKPNKSPKTYNPADEEELEFVPAPPRKR